MRLCAATPALGAIIPILIPCTPVRAQQVGPVPDEVRETFQLDPCYQKQIDGAISIARDPEPDTGRDSFFICVGDQPELDFGGR